MVYEVIIARGAIRDFKTLDARWRSAVKKAMRKHLTTAPTRESKSKVKRLEGLRQPQYRLRVDRVRVFYDVNEAEKRVEVLGFVMKSETQEWLEQHGVME